ncbi:MAG: hypothetical protein JNM20_00935 [Rhizobiales bacterium]|nr:hypothetical protein [Hyphomicrobiales bacterium]
MTDATGKSIGPQRGLAASPRALRPLERDPRPVRKISASPGPFGAVAGFAASYAWATAGFSIVLIFLIALAIALHPLDLDHLLETRAVAPEAEQRQAVLDREFPGVASPIVISVESDIPGQARASAALLATELTAKPQIFTGVFAPGTGRFFEDFGILYLNSAEVEKIGFDAEKLMPLMQALATAPNVHGLAALTEQVARAVEEGRSASLLEGLFAEAAKTAAAAASGTPRPFDWEGLVNIRPKLDDTTWFVFAAPAAASVDATGEARKIIADLAARSGPQVKMLLTGEAVVSETAGAGFSRLSVPVLIMSGVFLVVSVMFGAGNWRSGAAIAIMLVPIIGLGFQLFVPEGLAVAQIALAPGLAVAVLSAMCFVVRFENHIADHNAPVTAIALAARQAGPLIVLAPVGLAAAACAGYVAAVPVVTMLAATGAALGLLAAVLCLTLLPASLMLLRVYPDEVGDHWIDSAIDAAEPREPFGTALGALIVVAAVAGAVLLPGIPFGTPGETVSVPPDAAGRAYAELTKRNPAFGSSAQILAPSFAEAANIQARLANLPEVRSVRWIGSFLPPDEEVKRQALARLQGQLPDPPNIAGMRTNEELIADYAAWRSALARIAGAQNTGGLGLAARSLSESLYELQSRSIPNPQPLRNLETALFVEFPGMLQRLSELSQLPPLTERTMDEAIRNRFISKDGQFRLEVVPAADADKDVFAAAVLSVAPDAMGSAITHMFEIDALRRAMIATVFFVLAAQILVAGAVLRHLTRALASSVALAAAIALAGGLVWLLGKPVIPMTAAMLFLLPALGLASTISMATMRAKALALDRAVLVSGIAMIGATLPLALLPIPDYAAAGQLALFAILATLLGALLLVPQLVRLGRRMGNFLSLVKS